MPSFSDQTLATCSFLLSGHYNVKEGGSLWQYSPTDCCCSMKTPPAPTSLSLKALRSVFVCVWKRGGVALVGKQTKTHIAATLLSLAARHPPHHKPQLTAWRASHTHTPMPNQLLPQIHTDMAPGSKSSAALLDLQR